MNRIHKDCFAYQNSSEKGCGILKALYCKSGKCKFYKLKREGKYLHQIKNRN